MTTRGGPPQVKNRAPAPIQITAEQLLREAKERGLEDAPRAPKQYITDKEELQLYRQNKRKDFEDQIRRQRHHIGTWTKYALWEASQKEFERSRSVFERALDVDYRNQAIWLKYAEMEMKNKFINHARNVWDRAVTLHPRVDMFWYKYSYMEEMISAIDNARQIFERWMKWEPDDMGWASYVKFEMRQGEIPRARGVFERYVKHHPTCRAYLKYAKWEESQHQKSLSRTIYERAMEELHPQEQTEKLLINFARFEERCKEFERARVIFKFALGRLTKESAPELYSEYLSFEKRHGSRQGIEDAILNKRRLHYEEKISADKFDYDTWFDFCRLEQEEGDVDRTRAVYDRAVACVPPVEEKKYWKRYVYLWVFYAVFEELKAKDVERARAVLRGCLDVIPHRRFTFGKIWVLAAQLEVRQKDLAAARKLLGTSIGMCGKESVFKAYISLELQLGEVDRCRSVYAKYLETLPYCCDAWQRFAGLEVNVGEIVRARSVFELAVSQSELDMPETLWRAYIDFEIDQTRSALQVHVSTPASEGGGEGGGTAWEDVTAGLRRVRALYERLLEKTTHVKVWISYGQFEATWCSLPPPPPPPTAAADAADGSVTEPSAVISVVDASAAMNSARTVFTRGYDCLRDQGLKEERVLLLQAWRAVEAADTVHGRPADVEAKFPRKVKMRRVISSEEGGGEGGLEEYFDYSFPDDEKPIVGIKILENAMKWKQMMQASSGAATADAAEESEQTESTDRKRKAEEQLDIDDVDEE